MEINYIPRVVFELQYDFMLNFGEVYRKLLGPFVRLAKNISILDEGKLTETLRFEFAEDKLRIDVGPERMVLLTEGEIPLTTFEHSTSSGKIFFEILDKLRKVETFGNFKQYLLLMECLVEVEGDKIAVVKKLQDAYFSPGFAKLKGDSNVFSANFGFKHEDATQSLHIGYFDSSIFTNAHDLFTFNRTKIFEYLLKESNGIYLNYRHNETDVSKVDIKMLREITQNGFNHLKTIIEHGKF